MDRGEWSARTPRSASRPPYSRLGNSPALLCRMCRPPQCCTAFSIAVRTLSSWLASAVTEMQCPPASDRICAVCSPVVALSSATTIISPLAAVPRAVARPIPVPEGVDQGNLSMRRAISNPLHEVIGSIFIRPATRNTRDGSSDRRR